MFVEFEDQLRVEREEIADWVKELDLPMSQCTAVRVGFRGLREVQRLHLRGEVAGVECIFPLTVWLESTNYLLFHVRFWLVEDHQ